jgi:hypothetical protein
MFDYIKRHLSTFVVIGVTVGIAIGLASTGGDLSQAFATSRGR